ncbi:adenylyltransferase/cytidyltransferase family protein [bacterium]|nr:adenylyltransferase/cytidyltransferase family protein [bacterium]
MKKKAIIVSGYFNPLHKGHIEYFYNAKKNGEKLLVILNNDNQRLLKGSKKFMDQEERMIILKELKVIDEVILSIDTDMSVSKTIEKIYKEFSNDFILFFANGGDQKNDSIPESLVCKRNGIKLIDGLGDKVQSSSWILKYNR